MNWPRSQTEIRSSGWCGTCGDLIFRNHGDVTWRHAPAQSAMEVMRQQFPPHEAYP